jgi:hypothetical protein
VKGSDHGLIEVLFQHLPAGTEKEHAKLEVMIAGLQVEIRVQILPNCNSVHAATNHPVRWYKILRLLSPGT